MTTRAQDFKAQKLGQHDSARAKKSRAKAAVRTTHQAKAKLDHAAHATHNQAERTKAHSSYSLEKGTRKSSRGAANRAKADSTLRNTATVRTSSPGARAARKKEGGGQKKNK